MKNLIYLLVVTFFFSCEKNDILPANDLEQGSVLNTRSPSSDVKVENGYLALENFRALDSISDLLEQMGELERVAWENKIKFESAYTHFKPYFEAFDALNTIEEMESFQVQHKSIIQVINDDECCDIEYPFQTRGKASILSKDGKIKVGTSLWLFKADRKISINDATESRINKYKDAVNNNETEGIYIDYYNAPRTRAGQVNGFQSLANHTEKSSKRRYFWSLDIYPEKDGRETRLILALYQQAKKKKFMGGYNTYKTKYTCRVEELSINNTRVYDPVILRTFTSGEKRGGRYFGLVRSFYPADVFPNFHIVITHGSRGCFPSGPLTFTRNTAFPPFQNTQLIFKYSGV